tara:strand:+ start:561 stop:827 length:267 start_codon:yes stop_codon:yes gene_type:complete
MKNNNEKQPKSWKQIKIFDSYQEASTFAQSYGTAAGYDEQLLVKIRRCGPGGSKFKIKIWHPDFVKPKKTKKEKKNVQNKKTVSKSKS